MKLKALLLFSLVLLVLYNCEKTPNNEPTPPAPSPVALAGLHPSDVFGHFEQICAIPHESGDTKAISNYMVKLAQDHKLAYVQDESNNVVIYAPASKGYEQQPSIALQGHLDMVCVSTDPANNPAKVGVKPVTDGKIVWAEGTSLGADDGIGVSILLAILSNLDKLPHPSLEFLFTTDEELGFIGAVGLDMSLIKSRRMISADCENETECVVTSAATSRLNSTLPVKRESSEGLSGISVNISGLLGGHSGVDIHRNRTNAIVLMSQLLQTLMKSYYIRIVSFTGGQVYNSIPTVCEVTIATQQAQFEQVKKQLDESCKAIADSLKVREPGLVINYSPESVGACLTETDSRRIIEALCSIPDGCIEMSEISNDQAAVSINTGVVKLENEAFTMISMLRSNKQMAIDPLIEQFKSVITRVDGECEISDAYDVWEYKEDSPLREKYLNSFSSVVGRKPVIASCHGGLEAGLFVEKIPDLDIISIGPTIYYPHTVNEQVEVPSVAHIYETLCYLLKDI